MDSKAIISCDAGYEWRRGLIAKTNTPVPESRLFFSLYRWTISGVCAILH
jgi:hypothetical protein